MVTEMEINSQRAIYQRLFQPTLVVIPNQLVYNMLDPVTLHNVLQVLHGKSEPMVGDAILEFKSQRAEFSWMRAIHLAWA